MFASACGGLSSNIASVHADMASQVGEGTRPIASMGAISVSERSFAYAASKERVLGPDELRRLGPAARELLIRKALFRRALVQEALEKRVFDEPGAAAYLLPRLEMIIEDYYVATSLRGGGRVLPDERVIGAYLKERGHPAARAAHLRARLQAALERERRARVRERLVAKLVKRSPPRLLQRDTPRASALGPGRGER